MANIPLLLYNYKNYIPPILKNLRIKVMAYYSFLLFFVIVW